MPTPRSLLRLLQVRSLEEERRRLALESSHQRLEALERQALAEVQHERQGRKISIDGAVKGSLVNRVAGRIAEQMAKENVGQLQRLIETARIETERKRNVFLTARTQRQQLEALVERTKARDAVETARQTQKELDNLPRKVPAPHRVAGCSTSS